jgi:hypothetical protein
MVCIGTTVDQLITSKGFVTTLLVVMAVRSKFANCSFKAVKGTQYKLE